MPGVGRQTLIATLLLISFNALAQSAVEPMPQLRASDVLPDHLLAGPYHRVREEVRSDGYLNYYTVDSDFGSFEVQSNIMLAVRVHEFEALVELERVSKTKVFATAAVEAGLSPAKTVLTFVRNPVNTLVGLPDGIGRMFKRYRRSGKESVGKARDTVEDITSAEDCSGLAESDERQRCDEKVQGLQRKKSLTDRYFKVSDAERRWHEKLGTDPYTSNDVLYEAVKSVAWADRLGRFSVRFTNIPAIPGAGYIADVSKIVWSKDPYELADYNQRILREAGLDQALSDAFFANSWFSPSMQTTLIAALASLPVTSGRQHVMIAATNTNSEAEARFVLEAMVAMTWYDAEVAPIDGFHDDDRFPVASTAAGKLLVILPVDYLIWTAEMAALASDVAGQHAAAVEAGNRELWLFGGVSELARQGIEALGWQLLEQQAAAIRASVGAGIEQTDDE